MQVLPTLYVHCSTKNPAAKKWLPFDLTCAVTSHSTTMYTAVSRAGGYRLLKLSSNNLVTKKVCKVLQETPTYLLLGVLKSGMR